MFVVFFSLFLFQSVGTFFFSLIVRLPKKNNTNMIKNRKKKYCFLANLCHASLMSRREKREKKEQSSKPKNSFLSLSRARSTSAPCSHQITNIFDRKKILRRDRIPTVRYVRKYNFSLLNTTPTPTDTHHVHVFQRICTKPI